MVGSADLMMPNVSGWQLLDQLQGHLLLGEVPIFIITAARYAGLERG
jgi:CheY-like chemotaxis protein